MVVFYPIKYRHRFSLESAFALKS